MDEAPLSQRHEVVGENILLNIFFKTTQLHLEVDYEVIFLKKKPALIVKMMCAKQDLNVIFGFRVTHST